MRTLVSRIATFLLAPVMLSVSCFSCLVQMTPVYAATSSSSETVINQPQDCEASVMEESPRTTDTPIFSERNVHAVHTTVCTLVYIRTSTDVTRLEQTVFHPTMINDVPDIYKTTLLSYRLLLYSPPPPLPYNRLLTGTTIKKE